MRTSFVSLVFLTAAPAFAQHADPTHSPNVRPYTHAHGDRSPYIGMHNRKIKALSEQQIFDLQNGKGMSFAMPAELNGYPGPSHVLELAEALELSQEQRFQTEHLFKKMQTEAKVVGEQVVAREAELDDLFKDKRATLTAVQHVTVQAAQAHGQLRATHLKYHLAMMEILTLVQVSKYIELRGYALQ